MTPLFCVAVFVVFFSLCPFFIDLETKYEFIFLYFILFYFKYLTNKFALIFISNRRIKTTASNNKQNQLAPSLLLFAILLIAKQCVRVCNKQLLFLCSKNDLNWDRRRDRDRQTDRQTEDPQSLLMRVRL